MAYAKLFSTITESSLWSASKDARLLFLSMLAKADQVGFVEAALPGLARMANLTLPETEAALAELMAPDPYSKSSDCDGRRVVKAPRGWCLVNYEAYRDRRDEDQRRDYMRKYMRDYRSQGVKGDCVYCGAAAVGVDHVIPTSKGGPDTIDNIVPCCLTCNTSKGDLDVAEWLVGSRGVRNRSCLQRAITNPIVAKICTEHPVYGKHVSQMLAQAEAEAEAEAEGEREGEAPAPTPKMTLEEYLRSLGVKLTRGGDDLMPEWTRATKGLKARQVMDIMEQAKPGIEWPSQFRAARKERGV